MMRTSQIFKASHHAVPSPDGTLIACISNQSLIIRSTNNSEVHRAITLAPQFATRINLSKWSPLPDSKTDSPKSYNHRIFLADTATVRLWDTDDENWTAVINNAGGSLGKIANVEFGRDSNEILVFTEFGIKLTVWFLDTGRNVEITDPKFATKGFDHRPSTGHFALLTRPAAHDVVTLHEPGNYSLLKSFLVSTIDAQGLKWSPCGRWIAIWDTPSSGYKVMIYTSEGHLFRTYAGPSGDDSINLGVKSVDWTPCGKYLAIGGYDSKVTMLKSTTFSPAKSLLHVSTLNLPSLTVWQELVSSDERVYSLAPQPMSPPMLDSSSDGPHLRNGVSILAFNSAESGLVATRVDSMPTTAWIWSLEHSWLLTVLVHHSPIKSLSWHPTLPGLLMIRCAHDDGVVYLWEKNEGRPQIFSLPLEKLTGKYGAQWVNAVSPKEPVVMLNDAQSYVIGYLGEAAEDEGESEADSLSTSALQDDNFRAQEGSLFDVVTQPGDNIARAEMQALRSSDKEWDMIKDVPN
ncbi:WD40 repeat-like protein [Xylona heveae TC161]|uniref:WD40 repeat-like protein n=1 Tax=Xylona heveae (strain CBS 132557 / TC161) TaxID=1328760 RepID=A0A161TDQ8_XYLHT|nr:WD40 repeat-like protein [Xylona heveae TC161]KZF24017.1 WD40 repeat-like protein [Xylona heveae TC161]